MLFFNRRVILEEEVPVVCTRSPQYDVVNKWSHDQKIKAEVRQAESLIRSASLQGDSYWSGDDKLSDSFEMMHTSPDLFSQSLFCNSFWHAIFIFFSNTLEGWMLFLVFKTVKRNTWPIFFPKLLSQQAEINSVSLFSCSNHSLLSPSSSPLRLVEPAWIWKQVCPEWWTGY